MTDRPTAATVTRSRNGVFDCEANIEYNRYMDCLRIDFGGAQSARLTAATARVFAKEILRVVDKHE